MKQNEIIQRQNRVVYALLVLVGLLGLAWAVWRHWYLAQEPAASPTHASRPAARPRPLALGISLALLKRAGV